MAPKASPPTSGGKENKEKPTKEKPTKDKKEVVTAKPSNVAANSAVVTEKAADAAEAASKLSALRPRRRLIFFVVFVLFLAWIVVCFNPCRVKKKEDCGFSGISATNCMTVACFTKGGGEMTKKTIKLKRGKDSTLGLAVVDGPDSKYLTVQAIEDGGVVKAYNAELPADSEDRILSGDSIWKVAGEKGKKMKKAITATGEKTLEIEIRRSKLPAMLNFLHNPEKVSIIEMVLTAPGFRRWGDSFSKLSGFGFACWIFSGYPVASLPMYFTLSGAVSWYTTKCCHDEKVGGSTPHCYKGGAAIDTVLKAAWKKTSDLGEKVAKDPQGYWKWFVYG